MIHVYHTDILAFSYYQFSEIRKPFLAEKEQHDMTKIDKDEKNHEILPIHKLNLLLKICVFTIFLKFPFRHKTLRRQTQIHRPLFF